MRLRDGLLALDALLLARRCFLETLGFAPLLLPLELSGGLARVLVADLRRPPLCRLRMALLPCASTFTFVD